MANCTISVLLGSTLGLWANLTVSALLPSFANAENGTPSAATPKVENQYALPLDLKGGSLIWRTDGTILRDGKPVTCPNLKAEFPGWFRKSGPNPPRLNEDCTAFPGTGRP
jgi:hypothetical protein